MFWLRLYGLVLGFSWHVWLLFVVSGLLMSAAMTAVDCLSQDPAHNLSARTSACLWLATVLQMSVRQGTGISCQRDRRLQVQHQEFK